MATDFEGALRRLLIDLYIIESGSNKLDDLMEELGHKQLNLFILNLTMALTYIVAAILTFHN